MVQKETATIDIGSSKIVVTVAEKSVNNTFKFKSQVSTDYDGFADGAFFSSENFVSAIKDGITKAETNLRYKIKKVYVSVPSEFSSCITKEINETYPKRKKIKDFDVYQIFDNAQDFPEDSFVINRSPIYFLLDDNRKVLNPVGEVTTRLNVLVSFVFCNKNFVDLVTNALNEMGILDVNFVSSALSEGLYLVEPEIRDNSFILIDSGYITTSVALIKGDGLIALKAFSLGGGHITGDLCQVLNISFSQAENLKKNVVLSLDATDDDFYEVNIDGQVKTFSTKLVNEIILARLEDFGNIFNKILNAQEFVANNYSYLPIYLTGGGLSNLKGAKDYISQLIGKNIEIIAPSVPQLNKPQNSSNLALIDVALKQEKSLKKGILNKLFSK